MPFVSVADEIAKKSFTYVENKFIKKYLPVLEPMAVKVYLYTLYLFQNGLSGYTLADLAASLALTEDEAKGYFEYLEEFELVAILCRSPFEIKILDAENVSGAPKKFKPEKYSDFTKSVQSVLSGRMISTNEFREYFTLLEDYGFEQNALIMIINYCVNLRGNDIRFQYIKKVAKSFAEEGATTAKKVDEKLSAYTSSTPALIRIFNAAGIRRQPDVDDDRLYKKWTKELGFEENAIVAAAKHFKAKSAEKIDAALEELYKNKKFDAKEIEDYCNSRSSVYALTGEIARNLGVYMQNSAPYVENYVNAWCNYGYSFESLKTLAVYCFRHGKNSFEDLNEFIAKLYDEGVVSDGSVNAFLESQLAEEKLLKEILSVCGLTRKVIEWDRKCLQRWRGWNFSDEMLYEAAKISAGKSNPLAYMNGVLSAWKNEGVFTTEAIPSAPSSPTLSTAKSPFGTPADGRERRAEIERHYYDLRHAAEQRAEDALKKATADEIYGGIRKQLNSLSIKLAFAELRDKVLAEQLSKEIAELERRGDIRLKELSIDKADFTPKYRCSVCNDTGYDKTGAPCACMKRFLAGEN